MPKGDCLEIEGVVTDIFKDDIKIKLINGHVITGYLAGKLVKDAAMLLGGSGGGRPDLASGAGRDLAKLNEVKDLIK